MAWRVAESVEVLRRQINAMAPDRSLAADGGIGDEAHASRDSDHNPWIKDGKFGIVSARDFTHDPLDGVDAGKLADAILASRDPRIKYLISNGRIASGSAGPKPWVWRKYGGKNKHTLHFHISVKSTKAHYDGAKPWDLSQYNFKPDVNAPKVVEYPILRQGDQNSHVKVLQAKIGAATDGFFGPKTKAALIKFQKAKGLVADGIAGPYTWEAVNAA